MSTASLGVNETEKVLDKPWRDIEWTEERRNELFNEISRYKPSTSSVSRARILLVGPVGVGKSSFFNSINSVFHGHITNQAVTGTTQERSTTLKFRTYQIEAGQDGEPLPFILCDTMGLEKGPVQGLDIEDIPNILEGRIGDRYQFSPVSSLEDSKSSKSEKLEDKIHCVAYFLEVPTISLIPDTLLEKLREIRKKVNKFVTDIVKVTVGKMENLLKSAQQQDVTVLLQFVQSTGKLDGYLACVSDKMDLLNSFPYIRKLSLKLNTGLPASAACERLFSSARLVFAAKRATLNCTNFEKQLLLKLNSKFTE